MFRAHNKTLKKQDGSPLALMDTTWPQLFLHLCERPASVMCVISSRVENVIIPMLRVLASLDRYIPTIKSKRKREKHLNSSLLDYLICKGVARCSGKMIS